MNHKLRSRLDLFHPEISGKVESHQAKQKELCDQRSFRQFTENDKVYVQDFTTRKPKWIPGTVIEITGPLTYISSCRMEQLYKDMWTMLERERTQLLTRILTPWFLT